MTRGRPIVGDEPRNVQINVRVTKRAKRTLVKIARVQKPPVSQATVIERGIYLAAEELLKKDSE